MQKDFDDEEWLQDVPEDLVAEEGREVDGAGLAAGFSGDGGAAPAAGAQAPVSGTDATATPKPKVRPIQMGEFLRKWVSKRLLKLNGADVGKIMASMRQLGVGVQGGAEAFAIFQQLLYDEWAAGRLGKPLARVKVDEKTVWGRCDGTQSERPCARVSPGITQLPVGSICSRRWWNSRG